MPVAKKISRSKPGKNEKRNTLKLQFDTSWSYEPAPESKSAASIKPQYDLFINGQWQKPLSKKYFDSINPADEEKLSEVAEASAADVNRAVAAARNAYEKTWSRMLPKERAKYIFRLARMIQEKARELAIIESLDGGKPIRESRDFDVPTAANHFFYYAGWADKLEYAFPNRKPRSLGVAG
ncbi:MAG TPA: aldehyde dehydrogenase family protein, partial [Chitinophagaceae bacterium]|nr:aldehyde dehydrogenase family protein [Chitinophagaceae bacterium]